MCRPAVQQTTKGRRPGWLPALFAVVGLTACAYPVGETPDTDPQVAAEVDRDPSPTQLAVCHGYGCSNRSIVQLTAAEWLSVLALFQTPAPNAADERRRAASAVALLERAAGQRTGTAADQPRAPLIFIDPTQQDCVDESINTSTYLNLLDRNGLLRWHKVGEPVRRGSPFLFNLHYTAVLTERDGGRAWAIDSWFFANGVPPAVVPLPQWQRGWDPQQNQRAAAATE